MDNPIFINKKEAHYVMKCSKCTREQAVISKDFGILDSQGIEQCPYNIMEK